MTSSTKLTKRNKEKIKNENQKPQTEKEGKISKDTQTKDFKYGPLPKFPGQRVWARGILIVGIVIYIAYFSKTTKETTLAKQTSTYNGRAQNVECSTEYLEDIKHYPRCVPKTCGRYVSDQIVTPQEADILIRLAVRIMAQGGSSGGASILDLHSGTLSYKEKFINIYKQNNQTKILTELEKSTYQQVRKKIQLAIGHSFGIDSTAILLTYPTFFSRLSNVDPKTHHDEYWHEHIDKHTYESFHYTSLLYLNDYGKDFKGGRFVFMDNILAPTKNVTVEPKKGRVLMFTSGSENPHYVERVTEGLRFAITVSFTCIPTRGIQDPFM